MAKTADKRAPAKLYRLYEVTMIHRLLDWDAVLLFKAQDARKARAKAPKLMRDSHQWLPVRAKLSLTKA